MLIDLCLGGCDLQSLQAVDPGVLSGLVSRLSVESYVLNCLGPRQQRLGPRQAAWLSGLRQQVSAATVQNLLRDEELGEALARLAGEGIDLMLLKGAALRVERRDLAGRFQCDVDVLLRREHLETAEALLSGMGFRLDDSYLDRQGLLENHFHFGFERRGAVIELHWDLDASSPPGFLDRFWARSRAVVSPGCALRVPSPEHQLLFGCLHLSRHSFFNGLRWLADLKLLLPVEGAREGFAAEAAAWPRRAAYGPLWYLAACGVPEAAELADGFGADRVERALLRRLLPALLLGEPWMGLPGWRAAKALHEWLFSEEPLLAFLAGASREGISSRFQANWGEA
ncbi:MAG: nucleotidyltransferase family protein [Thermoanaerobaculia bacterium]